MKIIPIEAQPSGYCTLSAAVAKQMIDWVKEGCYLPDALLFPRASSIRPRGPHFGPGTGQ